MPIAAQPRRDARMNLAERCEAGSEEKQNPPEGGETEASTGFEPVVRVLQTLALPLGHDAISEKKRAGDGIRTHDLLLGKETFYH